MDVAVKAVAGLPKECLARVLVQGDGSTVTGGQYVDRWLADNARTNKPKTLKAMTKALRAYLDPDSQDAGFDPDGHLKRSVTLRRDSLTGMATLHAVLTAPDAAVLQAYLKNAARPTPPTQVEQQQPDGSTQLVLVQDQRWAAQRRYDALIPALRTALTNAGLASTQDADGANAAADAPAPADYARPTNVATTAPNGPAVTLLLTATVEQVAAAAGTTTSPTAGCATLDGIGPVPPAMLEYLSCNATVQSLILSADDAPLQMGRSTRFATANQKRAALRRDGGCVVPGCDCPFVDFHHVIHWATGGPTDIGNLLTLCSTHHTETHLGIWEAKIVDGAVRLRPPNWIDPERRWIRNPRKTNDDAVKRAAEQLALPVDLTRADPAA